MQVQRTPNDPGPRYQCPACGIRFADLFAGLAHTERAPGNVPLRKL